MKYSLAEAFLSLFPRVDLIPLDISWRWDWLAKGSG